MTEFMAVYYVQRCQRVIIAVEVIQRSIFAYVERSKPIRGAINILQRNILRQVEHGYITPATNKVF